MFEGGWDERKDNRGRSSAGTFTCKPGEGRGFSRAIIRVKNKIDVIQRNEREKYERSTRSLPQGQPAMRKVIWNIFHGGWQFQLPKYRTNDDTFRNDSSFARRRDTYFDCFSRFVDTLWTHRTTPFIKEDTTSIKTREEADFCVVLSWLIIVS